MPRAKEWYKTDFDSAYGEPVKIFTMEDLIQADKEIVEKEENIKQDRKDLLEGINKLLLTSKQDFGQLDDVTEIQKM